MIQTKETLIKAKEENSDRVVTRNISYFCRILKDSVFPNNTSDESDNDFKYSRYDNNANHNQNNRCYPYLTDNPLADMVLHLNTAWLLLLISNAIYTFHYSRTRYFRSKWLQRNSNPQPLRRMINTRKMLWRKVTRYIERLTFDFILYFDQLKCRFLG